MQPCSTEQLPTTQSDKETTDHNHPTSPVSSDDDNYITADEQDDDDFTDAPASTPESDRETSAAASSHSDVNDREVENWTHISNHRDLPKNESTIKCLFPGYEDEIICKILSRGGKSTTSNWHFLNIQEDGENVGKCCSFKVQQGTKQSKRDGHAPMRSTRLACLMSWTAPKRRVASSPSTVHALEVVLERLHPPRDCVLAGRSMCARSCVWEPQ